MSSPQNFRKSPGGASRMKSGFGFGYEAVSLEQRTMARSRGLGLVFAHSILASDSHQLLYVSSAEYNPSQFLEIVLQYQTRGS